MDFKDDFGHLEFKLWRSVDAVCISGDKAMTFADLVQLFRARFTRHIETEEMLLEKRKNVGRVDEILRELDSANNRAQVELIS